MEFKDVFSRKQSILDSYKSQAKIQFKPRGTGNQVMGAGQDVVPADKITVNGESFSFSEFVNLLEMLFKSQEGLAGSFEANAQVSFKDGPLSRFLASSLFLSSLGSVNQVSMIDSACKQAFGMIDFSRKPQVAALDKNTSEKIKQFFSVVDTARNVVEEEAKQNYANVRKNLGDYANVINRWYKEAKKEDLWSSDARGWVEDADRFPSFLSWAATKLQLLNRPNANLAPDQQAALERLSDVISPRGAMAQQNAQITKKAQATLHDIIQKYVVESGDLPVWFRIRVLVVFLQEAGMPTYSVRQDPDKRQAKSVSQYIRRVDAVGGSDYPEDLDKDVSIYSDTSLRSLIDSFHKMGSLNEAVSRDLGNMAVSELLKNSSPVNIFHGLNRRVLNNFFMGGVSAKNINGSILKGFDQQKQDEYGAYFAQKFYNNFVDFCALVGFQGKTERAFKLINVFLFSGKDEQAQTRGAYAVSVLFPITLPDVGVVLANNRSIELAVRKERKQETGFVAELRNAIQMAGGTANVFIVDQQGQVMSVLQAPWDKVNTTGKSPTGQGGIEGVRDSAHADVMIFGKNKAGNPANLSISLKNKNSPYWGGMSYERSLTNQSNADRAQGSSNIRTSSEVDGFAIGVRQAYLLAENGEKAVGAVIENVKKSVEETMMRTVPDKDLVTAIQASYNTFVMLAKSGGGLPQEFAQPLIALFSAMQQSHGFAAQQIKMEYRAKSFKDFRKPEGSGTSVVELFWSLIYDKEGVFRRALFGDLADSARSQSGAESASHVIVGHPKIEVNGNDVVITPVGAEDGTVILSNPKFTLHNPVDPTEVKKFGITQNLEFFKGALPVLMAGQSSGQSMAGIPDLYPRIAPIRRLVGQAMSPTVEKRVEELYGMGSKTGEISKEQFEAKTKQLSDDLAASITPQGKFRIESRSLSDDVTKFVSVYRNKKSSTTQLVVDVFLALGDLPTIEQAAIAEAVIQIQLNPNMLMEEVESVVRGVLSEVFAKMPAMGPSVPQAAPQPVDNESIRKALQAQIERDLNMLAKQVQDKLQTSLPKSLASVQFITKLLPFKVRL